MDEAQEKMGLTGFLKDGLGNVWCDGKEGKYINLDNCAESIRKGFELAGYRKPVDRPELREIGLVFCMNSTCYLTCTFPDMDCPQVKVARSQILDIIDQPTHQQLDRDALIRQTQRLNPMQL